MRKHMNLTIVELESKLNELPPASQAYADYLEEVGFRSTPRAHRAYALYSSKRDNANIRPAQVVVYPDFAERIAKIQAALELLKINAERQTELLARLQSRPSLTDRQGVRLADDWIVGYRRSKDEEAKSLQLESERKARESKEFWSDFQRLQEYENSVRERLLRLSHDQLMDLFVNEEWDDEVELRIMKAILKSQILG